MTVTLIGSRAMWLHYEDSRKPTGDWDYHSDRPIRELDWGSGKRSDVFTDSRLGAWPWSGLATPDELYTLKVSHAFWEINGPDNWNKHAADIVFLQRKGAKFLRELYDIVLPIWRERYKRHVTDLNQKAAAFFDDAVVRTYDHDSVHESIAYGDRPLYEAILREGSDVAVDNDKFWAMDHATQMRLIREEIFATALERILIPHAYRGSPRAAYHWALRRTATSLFRGEWALHLILNLDELMVPGCDYLRRHLSNLDKLRPLGEMHG